MENTILEKLKEDYIDIFTDRCYMYFKHKIRKGYSRQFVLSKSEVLEFITEIKELFEKMEEPEEA